MAVFTALTRAEAASFLTQFTLGELVDLQGISSGIENTNYFLTTSQGRYVLTVFERLTFKQLPFYLELMRHLARRGLPVPAPQENRSGALLSEVRGKPAAIVTRLDGQAVVQPTPAHCALVGDVLARMHKAGADFPLFQPHLRGIGWWKESVPKLEPHIPDDVFQRLADELIYQDSFFRSARFERLPAGPIHADLDAYHAVRPLTEEEHECWRTVLRAAALRFWISRLYDYYLPRPAEVLTPHDPSHFERILAHRIGDAALPWVSTAA